MKQSIKRNGQTPIYEQIYLKLRKKIDTAELAAGASFPSERELADKFSVSRMTVRQALNSLKQEGLIYQERGVGAFVSKRKLDVHTRNLVGFTEEMKGLGLKPSSKLLLFSVVKSSEEIAQELGLEIGDEVFYIQRLRLADDSPMAFEEAYLPAARYPNLNKINLEKSSLYEILGKEYGVKMDRAEEILEATAATKEIADALAIKKNDPLLVVRRVVFSQANLPVESVKTFYRSDRYRATFHLKKS